MAKRKGNRSSEEIKKLINDNLDNIEQWTRDGLTMEQMASNLGISSRTLYRYRVKPDSPVSQSIKNGRAVAVETLENTMFKSANGYVRKVTKWQKVKHCLYNEDGRKQDEWEEMVPYEEEVYYPPDTTAGIFLLKNWSSYMNEPKALELRKKELELKEKQIEENNW